MSIASYLKDIGRGKEGARSLDAGHAHTLMSAVLDGAVNDLELGAFVMAMRIKGESQDELNGFLKAVQARCLPLTPTRPTVVLPSYNGSRKLPNLTTLLALLLAQDDIQVLVHGPAHDPARVTTAEIFQVLGLPMAKDADDIAHAWSRREPVFITTEALCPPLARLLDVRWTVGLRNSGHTVAKLLDPCQGGHSMRVVNYTHPEYGTALNAFLQASQANAMLLRGTEGEPVADPRRLPRLDVFVGGTLRPDLSAAAQDGVLTELPVLPRVTDAATTALYIQSVISGEKPAPSPLLQQVACLQRALASMRLQTAAQPASAESHAPAQATVDLAAFEAELRSDGFVEAQTREIPAGTHNTTHAHNFEVRALMLEGEMKLSWDGSSRTYRAGEVFTMAAGRDHSEQFGDTTTRYLVGRKYPGAH